MWMATPTLQVDGVAAGAGCNLALGCDLIVASSESRFSEIFAKRGLSLDFGGSWVLPRLIGLHKAKELALFADIISAKEAEAMGLVNRIVPSGDINAFVDDWAGRLAAGPPIALAQTKQLLQQRHVRDHGGRPSDDKGGRPDGRTSRPTDAARGHGRVPAGRARSAVHRPLRSPPAARRSGLAGA